MPLAIIGMVVLAILCMPMMAQANSMNIQSMVYDIDGNIVEDSAVNVSIRIVDEEGEELYLEEFSDIPVVRGAMNLNVGESVGGIPMDALDPSTGRKFVDIMVDDEHPYDLMLLQSVPYSMWSDMARDIVPNSIRADHIQDGAIEL